MKRRKPLPTGAEFIGQARPAQPASVYAEDFSLLVRLRRLRIRRAVIRILH